MDLGLQNKVVFVAGSSRGIGKGIAAVFLDEGARVVVTGRDARSVAETDAELSTGRADRVMTFVGDLTDPDAVREAQSQTAQRWGAVDCLVCNLGSGTARNGWQLARSDWDLVFRLNLWATVGLVEAFLSGMVDAHSGNIIFVSSIAALESVGAPIPYGAAKAALERYSKDLSKAGGVGRHSREHGGAGKCSLSGWKLAGQAGCGAREGLRPNRGRSTPRAFRRSARDRRGGGVSGFATGCVCDRGVPGGGWRSDPRMTHSSILRDASR